MFHRNHTLSPNRWSLVALLLGFAWALSACATQPEARRTVGRDAATAPVHKVQTLEALMRKLKQGWDERRLDDPDFYAKELGYPVERPETFRVYGAKDSYRVIRFDEGELKGLPMPVHPMVIQDGRRALVVNAPTSAPMRCLKSDVLFEIWGPKQPTMPEVWGAHGMPMFWRYDYEAGAGGSASLFVNKQSNCFYSFDVSQYPEQ